MTPSGPDRANAVRLSGLATEQRNARTLDLDELNTLSLVERLNDEDMLVAPAVRAVLDDVARAVELVVQRLKQGGRVVYVGAGTSGSICALDAASCSSTFGVPRDLVWAVLAGKGKRSEKSLSAEDDEDAGVADVDDQDVGCSDVVIGVSAGGHTPYVLAAIRRARARGAATVSLADVMRRVGRTTLHENEALRPRSGVAMAGQSVGQPPSTGDRLEVE